MTEDNLYSTLANKIVLVTGARSGIGEALARRLAKLGAKVICTSRSEAKLKAVTDEINDAGGTAMPFAADATDDDQMRALGNAIKESFGGLDIAYLNAGANSQKGTIIDSEYRDWRQAFDQNMLPLLFGIKHAAPLMRARGGGRIVFTGTAMAHFAAPDNSSYCGGKAAARMIAKTAALELASDNITVNEFIPGPVRTEQAMKITNADDPNSPFNNPAEWVKEPDDVVDTLLFMVAFPGKGPNSQIFSLARR